MDALVSLFEGMPNHYKLGWIFLCLFITWIIEFGAPLTNLNYKKWSHAGVNMVFLFTSVLVNFLFGLVTVGVFFWLSTNEYGLLNMVELNPWIELLIAIAALDLIAQWFTHYLLHRISWMWKFHLVHHSDTKVDATTGTRHHPGDYLIREVFALATIVLFGIPLTYYLIYRFTTIFFTYISHGNIRFPKWLDKGLNLIFVTPDMHKFHHHFERPWTDSNFGNIFSIWDRIFGTLVYDDPLKVRYGVDVLEDEKADDVMYQLGIPFNKDVKTDY